MYTDFENEETDNVVGEASSAARTRTFSAYYRSFSTEMVSCYDGPRKTPAKYVIVDFNGEGRSPFRKKNIILMWK